MNNPMVWRNDHLRPHLAERGAIWD
jgi:hypothetical protein